MKITYDPQANALYIQFQEGKVGSTKKIEEGILVDLGADGKLFGIEVIGVSERMSLKELEQINTNLPLTKVA